MKPFKQTAFECPICKRTHERAGNRKILIQVKNDNNIFYSCPRGEAPNRPQHPPIKIDLCI